MAGVEAFERERELTEAITPTVESSVPGVEVLAVELLSPSRFCVYVDHPNGVDFSLCERVTRVLEPYRSDWTIDVSSPGPERPLRRRAPLRSGRRPCSPAPHRIRGEWQDPLSRRNRLGGHERGVPGRGRHDI